jgi:hypothetical protein
MIHIIFTNKELDCQKRESIILIESASNSWSANLVFNGSSSDEAEEI